MADEQVEAQDATSKDTPTAINGEGADTDNPGSASRWKARIQRCKKWKKDVSSDWDTNIDYRRGKPFSEDSDTDRIAVNKDWPLTKAKIAQLYSQNPEVAVGSDSPEFKPLTLLVRKAINARLKQARPDVCMEQVLPDTVNASGYGGSFVAYEALTEKKQVGTSLSPDPALNGQPVDLTQFQPEEIKEAVKIGSLQVDEIDVPLDKRFVFRRISPWDLLWDMDFTGSDFDDAAWVGYEGRCTWAEGKILFNLSDELKEKVAKGDSRTEQERASGQQVHTTDSEEDTVNFQEIFYWSYKFNPDEKSFKRIMRIVFVDGHPKPVIHEPWKGQQYSKETGQYVGACKFPVRFLTLSYLTDEPVPPSDSAIGRPQVDELIEGRTQMALQRQRSQPMRYFDVNRIDAEVIDQIMRGNWNGMIPVNGDGSRAIGEVARAQYPKEDGMFDQIANSDLHEVWQTGPNQIGSYAQGSNTATETKTVDANFQSRVGQERAKVVKFFLGMVDVMFGLMALYDDFKGVLTPPEIEALENGWNRKGVQHDFAFDIRPDSTVLLDSAQQTERLLKVLNLIGKAPGRDPNSIIDDILLLNGVDPAKTYAKPQEQKPEPINVSVRSWEDLRDPVFLALLFQAGQGPTPESLKSAMAVLAQVANPEMNPAADQTPAVPEEATVEGQQQGPPAPSEKEQGEWQAMPRISKRPDELGG